MLSMESDSVCMNCSAVDTVIMNVVCVAVGAVNVLLLVT